MHSPNLPYVAFQQGVLKEKVSVLTEEELSTLDEYIGTYFETQSDLRECPWRADKINTAQSDIDLERQYLEE